jgi:hypothetical protein
MPLVSIAVESGLCLLLESAAQRLGPTVFRRTLIIPPFPPTSPPKRWREVRAARETCCAVRGLAQVGAIPGLIGGPAYKGSARYKRSAGLRTPKGPRLRTCV